jgi:DNA repair exonuclease SbcCD nuclease subunit
MSESTKISFIFRTDVHVADHSPASWKGDYPAEIWNSLEQIGDLARRYDCQAVLDGGDYFHVKAPTRNSHRLVAKSAVVQAAYPCPTLCVEGNHDIKHNNLDTLSEQPLGVLYESGVFEHLRDTSFETDGVRVRVVGVPYSMTRTLEDLRAIKKQDGEYLVAVVHSLASENPPDHVQEFFGEPVFRYKDLVYKDGPDVWCFGHWHRDQGIVTIEGRKFVNQGSVSRGALVKENLTRVPKVALLEFDADGFEVASIPLKVAPASEVFDVERKERQDQETQTIEAFVDHLQADLEVGDDVSIEDTIETLNFSKEVGRVAVEYLEKAREGN